MTPGPGRSSQDTHKIIIIMIIIILYEEPVRPARPLSASPLRTPSCFSCTHSGQRFLISQEVHSRQLTSAVPPAAILAEGRIQMTGSWQRLGSAVRVGAGLWIRKMSASSGHPRPLIAVCQMTSTSDKERNLSVCSQLIREAASRSACMVFLPEAFDYIGGSTEETLSLAETLEGDIVQHYKGLARECGVWLSLGGFHEKGPNWDSDRRISNSHLILDNTGCLMSIYRKTHLFDVELQSGVSLRESNFTVPGTEIVAPVSTPGGKVGLAICYDLRFPEISLALTREGADILTYPSAFTVTTGLAHWEVLLRARAIENQCYVVAAAQTGAHNKRRTSYGHAMVVDPWGVVIAQCQDGEGLCYAEINLPYLQRVRQEMPVQAHRRADLYGCITRKGPG